MARHAVAAKGRDPWTPCARGGIQRSGPYLCRAPAGAADASSERWPGDNAGSDTHPLRKSVSGGRRHRRTM